MFTVKETEGGRDLQLTLTPKQLEGVVAAAIPPTALAWGCFLLLRGAEQVVAEGGGGKGKGAAGWAAAVSASAWAVVVTAAASAVFLVSSMQLMTLHQPLLQPLQRWPPAMELYYAALPWRISSG